MQIFHERLRNERIFKGYSQKQMAEILNIPRGTYIHYENTSKEGRLPSYELLVKISEILEVSIDYLLGKTDV